MTPELYRENLSRLMPQAVIETLDAAPYMRAFNSLPPKSDIEVPAALLVVSFPTDMNRVALVSFVGKDRCFKEFAGVAIELHRKVLDIIGVKT